MTALEAAASKPVLPPDYGAPYDYLDYQPGPALDDMSRRQKQLRTAWFDEQITAAEYAWALVREGQVYVSAVIEGHTIDSLG